MQAFFNGRRGNRLAMDMSFESFLSSGVMRRQALAMMCEPEVLILDYLHGNVDPDDDEELGQAFAEATELASDGQVWKVQLDPDDVRFVRQRLCRDHGMRLLHAQIPDLVA